MDDINSSKSSRLLRSSKNVKPCYTSDITNDTVVDFAMRLDTQVKKCMESLDTQTLTDLVPIIVSALTSFDEHVTELIECQKKRDSLVEKNKALNLQFKDLRSVLETERKAHAEIIDESDTHMRELTQERNQADMDVKRLKNKMEKDKYDIDCINQNIMKMSKENNRVILENVELKENIDTLREHLENLKSKIRSDAAKSNNSEATGLSVPAHRPAISDEARAARVRPRFQCSNVHILGDSNVRGLGALVKQYVRSYVQVRSSCVPGGGLCQLNSKFIVDPQPGDLIVIHAGTNDICSTKWEDIKQSLHSLINKFPECGFLIFMVPTRYDDYSFFNKHINKFNTLIKYAVQDFHNVHLIQTRRVIKTKFMKKDGIHYNLAGQNKLANKIVSFINQIPAVNSNQATTTDHRASSRNENCLQDELDESTRPSRRNFVDPGLSIGT